MNEKANNQPEHIGTVKIHQGASMRDMMSPLTVDSVLRGAVQNCWMMLPEAERSPERVEQEILRIIQRVLRDLKEDATAFGFSKENESSPAD